VVTANKPTPAYNGFYGKEAPYVRHLHTFGEYGVAHDAKTIRSKLENRGETCIFVGYADDHGGNVYRMFNLRTRHVWITHDVKWIRHPSGNEEMTERVAPPVMSNIVIDIETVPEVETVPDNDEEENDAIDHGTPADKDNEMNNNAGSVASTNEDDNIDPCILRQMKKTNSLF